MTMPPTTSLPPGSDEVTDDDLHALVDGQLDGEHAAKVMAWLLVHPDDAARVAAWQTQRLQLRRAARSLDIGETPAALTAPVQRALGRQQRRSIWQQAAAASVLLIAGLGAGHWWGQRDAGAGASLASAAPPSFVHDAALAHAVFTPEKRHPVEVAAADEAHLVQWLSRRLGLPLTVPTLTAQGYQLLGGRLLPGEGAPRAQFMYEDAKGERLTLYVTVFTAGQSPGEVAFRSVKDGARTTFYWVDERFGYALSGPADATQVQAVAREVYRQVGG